MALDVIRAVLFDKDGTLFDFRQSWGGWTKSMLDRLAPVTTGPLAQALGFDPQAMDFEPDSVVIASTMEEIATVIAAHVTLPYPQVVALMEEVGKAAPMVPAVDLPLVLGELRARGLRLGLATNDTEAPARAHLAGAGVLDLFDLVLGCDSGHGGKPAPGQLLAFAEAMGLPPGQIAMVGDSLHDLEAARRAGMVPVGVLTGPAPREKLSPHAEVVLDTIAGLGAWLDAR
ncbi:HAD family hydrolase [Stagnihabitans tardus]|uniref:phosphoglycolate phosphatase n=1 Tax=Stagnihabitans tardus TaxID=2699202 RepID=A0AAE5BVW8_9RHOB|nr:HAD family hydrolase [Stagnihabitans tardus]NBZ87693.1 HAD-IA family hydrolase [Stagnihabitans tardus]